MNDNRSKYFNLLGIPLLSLSYYLFGVLGSKIINILIGVFTDSIVIRLGVMFIIYTIQYIIAIKILHYMTDLRIQEKTLFCYIAISGSVYILLTILGNALKTNFVQENISLIVMSIIVSPLLEEIIFRGICFIGFKKYSYYGALILSVICFTLSHSLAIDGLVILNIIFGLIACKIVEKKQNVIIMTYIHLIWNSLVMLAGLLLWVLGSSLLQVFKEFLSLE